MRETMNKTVFKSSLIVSVAALTVGLLPLSGVANAASPNESLLKSYNANDKARGGLVIDSAMTTEQALGDQYVPAELKAKHDQIKPYLRVVPVVYWGFEKNPKVHIGQIVVHKDLVNDTNQLFLRMFAMKFPIQSVIPEAKFQYNDEKSMEVNNSSNYRPEDGSEHFKGAAFDLNTRVNPFDITAYDPSTPIQPYGAKYDPTAKGALTRDGAVRKLWTSYHYEWGGNWGNPNADPATDFYKIGYFDYQHFQLDYTRYDKLNLPQGF